MGPSGIWSVMKIKPVVNLEHAKRNEAIASCTPCRVVPLLSCCHSRTMLEGISPNYSTFSWLVDGYCNQNNEEEVLSIPDDIIKRGFCVDKSVYRSLIRRFCKRGLIDYAQKIHVNMQVKGIPGDSLVYAILSCAYLIAGKPIAASEILNNMLKNKLMITSKIYKCLCASYADRTDMLELFWNQTIEKGLISKNVYKLMQEARPNSTSNH